MIMGTVIFDPCGVLDLRSQTQTTVVYMFLVHYYIIQAKLFLSRAIVIVWKLGANVISQRMYS